MILVVTAVEFTQADLEIIKTVIDEDKVHVVWLGERLTTDIGFDVHIEQREKIDEGVVLVKHLLQERGVIFTP
jgi:bifunctional enzyme CysN/CysC